MKYCFKKQHIILDALSRLFAIFTMKTNINDLEALDINIYYNEIKNFKILNQIYAYQDILIAILIDFKQRLLNEYAKKKF